MAGLLQTLSAERARLKAEYDAIITLATGAGDYTDEQRARRDAILARVAQVDADMEAERKAADLMREAPALAVADAAPSAQPKLFSSLGEQLLAVRRAAVNPAGADQRLFAINEAGGFSAAVPGTGSNTTVGSDGGFLIQTDFQPGILDRIFAGSQVAQYCAPREIGAGFDGTAWNTIDETSRVDGSRGGGVQAYWIQEGASLTASRPKLARTEVRLGKLAALWYATDEQLQDATATESFASAEFIDELAFKLDDGVIRGTGSGVPQGVLTASALVSVAKETGQAATTVVAENVEKMFARLTSRSLGSAAWYINQDVWPQIFQLHHAVGTGGVPMFIPSGGITDTPGGSLLGRPVRPIEQASTLGTQGDIMFLDLSRYLVIRKGGVQQAASIHVNFLTDETAFRWILRVNGRPMPVSALTPYKGTATTSPFVALDTRA